MASIVQAKANAFGVNFVVFDSNTIAGKVLLLWEAKRDEAAGAGGGGITTDWDPLTIDVSTNGAANGDHGRWFYAEADGTDTFEVGACRAFAFETDLDYATFVPGDVTPYEVDNAGTSSTLGLGPVTDPTAGQLILYGAVYDTAFTGSWPATPGAGWDLEYNANANASPPSGLSDQHPHTLVMSWDGTTTPLTGSATIGADQPYAGAMIQVNGPECPEADFVGVPVSGQAPLEVAFTDLSTESPTSWLWDFGDGETSTAQNPIHTFVEPGVYTVSLSVGKAGCDDDELVRADYVIATLDCRAFLIDVYRPGVGEDAGELTFVETLCSAKGQSVRIEELGAGSGRFVINRHAAEATAAVLGDGLDDMRLGKVRIPGRWSAPRFGFWIDTGEFTLIAEGGEGDEDLTFGGLGALTYLDGARMAPVSYLEELVAVEDPVDGVWRFERPDFTSSLGFLASKANGTDALVDEWQLPAIAPAGDDVLLLAFVQVRPDEDLTLPGGWTNRVQQDTSLGANELRYVLADRYHATGAAPYDDVFEAAAPVRWTAAQLGFRATGGPSSPETGANHTAASGVEDVITAALSGSPTAGNILLAYITETTDGPGTISYRMPAGWTLLQRIPNKNTFTGTAAVFFKPADGTETDVEVTVLVDPAEAGVELTSMSLLVAEYPIVYQPLKAGEILYIVIAEILEASAGDRPHHPLPLLSIDFSYEEDSNGDPWDETPATAQFTARVGESIYDVVMRLVATGTIVVDMDVSGPGLLLRAFNRSTYGRDLTGTDFGEGVVLLAKGSSIQSALRRDRVRSRAAAGAWVLGDEGTWVFVEQPDAASRFPREVAIDAAGTTEGAALQAIGEAALEQLDVQAEKLTIGVNVGRLGSIDADLGQYFPGPGTDGTPWPGDFVTVRTGAGDFDYDDSTFRVAAISIAEPDGDDAAVLLPTDLDVSANLGSNMEPDELDSEASGGTGGVSVVGTGGGITPDLSAYQKKVEKSEPDGYASLGPSGYVPPAELGSGAVGDGSRVLADDGTWVDQATAASGAMVPYFIAAGDTFTVPEFKQALFAMTIDVEGTLVVDGVLIEVD